jgi:hypothetical protein
MALLYSLPAAVLLLLAVALAVAASLAAQVLVHRSFARADFVAHNDVGGIMITVAGALYAVVLGFLTVVAWEHFQAAREIVVQESGASIDAWHTAVGLPPVVRTRVRDDMLRYATIMVGREWPLMKRGGFDPQAAIVSMDAMDATGAFKPADSGQSNAQNATMQQLGVLHDARQRRIALNDSGVSWFQWLVLILGAVCIVGFCWLFGVGNQLVHLLMTATVVAIMAAILVLLFELQYPFRSSVSIPAQAWSEAIHHIHQMQAGALMDMRS